MEEYMTAAVTKFLTDNSSTILRTLGGLTMLGATANFIRTEGKNKRDPLDTKIQRLTIHNAIAALGSALTLWTLTTEHKIGTKTRLFCLATTFATTMYPAAMAYVFSRPVRKSESA
jgi:hypothetical protein